MRLDNGPGETMKEIEGTKQVQPKKQRDVKKLINLVKLEWVI